MILGPLFYFNASHVISVKSYCVSFLNLSSLNSLFQAFPILLSRTLQISSTNPLLIVLCCQRDLPKIIIYSIFLPRIEYTSTYSISPLWCLSAISNLSQLTQNYLSWSVCQVYICLISVKFHSKLPIVQVKNPDPNIHFYFQDYFNRLLTSLTASTLVFLYDIFLVLKPTWSI